MASSASRQLRRDWFLSVRIPVLHLSLHLYRFSVVTVAAMDMSSPERNEIFLPVLACSVVLKLLELALSAFKMPGHSRHELKRRLTLRKIRKRRGPPKHMSMGERGLGTPRFIMYRFTYELFSFGGPGIHVFIVAFVGLRSESGNE